MRFLIYLSLISIAGVVLAHTGVQNPEVMRRMNLMVDLESAQETLEKMAAGQIAYDAAAAQKARAIIMDGARQTITLFSARETDPKMEALPILWDEFDTFRRSSEAMSAMATAFDPTDRDAFAGAVRQIGATCTACHDRYRAQ